MKRYSILLLITLLAGSLVRSSVGSYGAQVPVGTGVSPDASETIGLTQADFTGTYTAVTLDKQGATYLLLESITVQTNTALTTVFGITADDITLDLGGHTVDGNGIAGGGAFITAINNITIKNGTMRDLRLEGVRVPTTTFGLTIDNLTLMDGDLAGILFFGTSFSTLLNNINIMGDNVSTGTGISVKGAAIDFALNNFNIDSLVNTTNTIYGVDFTADCESVVIRNGRISNIRGDSNTTANGLNFGAASFEVAINKLSISHIQNTGINLNNSYGVALNDITISNVDGGSGIEIGDTAYNIAMEDFSITDIAATTPLDGGIKFGTGAYAIALANGKINNVLGVSSGNGLSFTGTSYAVTLDNLAISNVIGRGIDFNASEDIAAANITISNSTRDGLVVGVPGSASLGFAKKQGFAFADIIINNSTLTGMTLNGRPEGIAINGMKINGAGTDGILITNRTHGMTMANVMIGSPGAKGINTTGIIDDITIEDFTVSHPATVGIDFAATSTRVSLLNGSISNPVSSFGIRIFGGSHSTRIENVTISDSGSDAINTGTQCHNITILNSKVSNITGDGMSFGNFGHNIMVENCQASHISTNGFDYGTNMHNILLKNCRTSYTGADGVLVGATSHGIDIKDCDFSLCKSDGIVLGNNCHRVFIHDFNISAHTTDGIQFGTNAHNIEIKRGAISSNNSLGKGIEFGTGAYKVAMEKLSIERGAAGILVGLSADSIMIKNSSVSNFFAASANYGIQFAGGSNIGLEDVTSTNCNEQSAGSNHAGIWFTNCSAVGCLNVYSNGHTGDEAYGFKIDTVTSGYFENCYAFKNTANATAAPSANVPEAAVGFFIKESTGCRFTNCKAADNVGANFAAGFLLTGCTGNLFENCSSLRNQSTIEAVTAAAAGFLSFDGKGNTWNNCIANGNKVTSTSTASTDGYGASGFYLGNEQQSTLFQCKANGNGLVANHDADVMGIFLDGAASSHALTSNDCKYCQIRECEASANCSSLTTGVTGTKSTYSAYGIRDDAANTSNLIIGCMAFGNKDASTPLVTTNYYMDLPIGGTTKANWPVRTGTMDSLIEFANLPNLYNIDIE